MAACKKCGSAIPLGHKSCDMCQTSVDGTPSVGQPWQPPVSPPAGQPFQAPVNPTPTPSWEAPVNPTPVDPGSPVTPASSAPSPSVPYNPAEPSNLAGITWTGGLVPPAIPPAPGAPPQSSWPRRNLKLLVTGGALAGMVALAAVAAALVLRPGPSVARLVPASADVYVQVALNPSATQKMNLLTVAHKFPDYKTDAQISQKLNDAFKDSDISFTSDIQPWLGSEAAFMVQLKDQTPAAMVILSRDDAKARAALAKWRAGKWGKKQTWKDQTYAGLTISVGTPLPGGSKEPTVYAYVDHAVVIANSDALIREIIDTDQGKYPRLIDAVNFKATVSQLPADRLALLYVNGASASKSIQDELKKQGTSALQIPQAGLDQLSAFLGLGFTISAKPNGITGDLLVRIDPSKLDAATSAALNVPSHKNGTLPMVPEHAYALVATIGLDRALRQAVDRWTSSDAQASTALSAMGFTGPGGALAHLTGDASLELGGDAQLASGALLIGTDDDASLRHFLQSFASFAAQGSSASERIAVKQEVYRGVALTTISSPELSGYGVNLTMAVTNGAGIIASSPQEAKALIDTRTTGRSITTAANFVAASHEMYSDYDGLFYMDLGELTTAIRKFLPASDQLDVNAQLNKAAPVKAIMFASQTANDRIAERLFVLIDSTEKT